jgi:GntR family transcriptional regulator
MGRPRYREIADDLVARLRGGGYAVGAMLPTEVELCEAYKVSRHTVREALRQLEAEGLVTRRQGSGTTVAATHRRDRFVQSVTDVRELLQYPENTRLFVLRARPVELEGEAWLRVEGVRRVRLTAAPICVVTLLIRPEYEAVLDDIGVLPGPVYGLIERRFGLRVGRVKLELSACGVAEDAAALLEVEGGAHALVTRRSYLDGDGRVFEVSEAIHPAERFTYQFTLERDG